MIRKRWNIPTEMVSNGRSTDSSFCQLAHHNGEESQFPGWVSSHQPGRTKRIIGVSKNLERFAAEFWDQSFVSYENS
ncbi:hypothetical protein TNIN_99271 [Trichonephila inaurata madagascariensis]|uniref:Uncharacterized protein n=1 Tax=Trichonephila inaurata madagascariensis TaxID=2747483 RepID=A0A8X7C130_9ARAC|nr:hypothetical protein TNIN_99271 [Trichonephila inaurata madagascariensis]